jgi:putative transposase
MTELGLSERRSCRLVGLARSVQQYRPVPKNDAAVVARMKDLASEYRRYGCPRLHEMLLREGLVVNHKRTYRLYIAQGLQVTAPTAPETLAASALPLNALTRPGDSSSSRP